MDKKRTEPQRGYETLCRAYHQFLLASIVGNDEVRALMRYPGGKSSCFHHLINLIPPHRTYIETHLGGGAVLRNKVAADRNVGIDRDSAVIQKYLGQFDTRYEFLVGRAEDFLKGYPFDGSEFVYLDPPYWPSARRSRRSPYRFDYTEADHLTLLGIISELPCPVMISGYRNSGYDDALADWYRHTFPTASRTGRRIETVWLNYKPSTLHDTRFLGRNFRERQAIKRRRSRWVARFRREPRTVQQALLAELVLDFHRGTKGSTC